MEYRLRKLCLKLATLGLLAPSAFSMEQGPDVVYGGDNRHNVDIAKLSHRTWAKSTAAMIGTGSLSQHPSLEDSMIGAKTGLRAMDFVCPEVAFRKEVALGSCSGTLIAPDLVLTAGHCVETANDCTSNAWVFDYTSNTSTDPSDPFKVTETFRKSNIYNCQEVLIQKNNDKTKEDFAVVRLDRAVKGRTPLKVRTSGKVPNQTHLVLIGHPSGLPVKISDGAIVKKNGYQRFFYANLDAFAGNSGSGVLNDSTGMVEGVLVSGKADFVRDTARSCLLPNTCTDEGCPRSTYFPRLITDLVDYDLGSVFERVTRTTAISGLAKMIKASNKRSRP